MESPNTQDFQEEFAFGSDGIIVLDRQLTIISFSEEAERILQIQMTDAVGKHIEELIGLGLESSRLLFSLQDTLANGTVHSNIHEAIPDTTGEVRHFLFSVSPLQSVQQEIVGAVVTFRDLDEFRRLLSELTQKNAEILIERNKLASILNSITDGVFTIDRDWKITSINAAAQRITGYTEEEALGKNCGLLLRGSQCDESCPMRKTLELGVVVKNMEVEIQTKGGKRIPISVNTALWYDDQGNIIGAVETFRDMSDVKQLTQALETRFRFDRILGKSKPMQELYDLLENVVETDSTVLIQGESGTGKELVARAIHRHGLRRNKPFVAVNCSALAENLLESELFGHEKGAFTGAIRRKPGRFELANGGTLFLDEVADMSPALQVKILRVLDEQVFERVGGTQPIRTNVRIIAATNKNLREEVNQGRFREDLYYRLNVVPIYLPPLRERKEDIPLLVNYFIEQFNRKMNRSIKTVSPAAMDLILQYNWPGNIRELENAIEQAFVRCRQDEIQVQHLPAHLKQQEESVAGVSEKPLSLSVTVAEKRLLQKVLQEVGGHRKKAALRLGISKATLWRKMKKYNLI